jgi:hypothetical protein
MVASVAPGTGMNIRLQNQHNVKLQSFVYQSISTILLTILDTSCPSPSKYQLLFSVKTVDQRASSTLVLVSQDRRSTVKRFSVVSENCPILCHRQLLSRKTLIISPQE